MDGTVKIEGLNAAMKAMRAAFPNNPRQQQRLLNASMRQAAKSTILHEAKSRAYSGDSSGALAEALGIRTTPSRALQAKRTAAGIYLTPVRRNQAAMQKYISFYYTRKGQKPGPKVVIDGIRHGHLVEFGTEKMAAKPFLWPAARSKTPAYRRRFAGDLKKKTDAAVRRARKKAGIK